MSSGTLPGFLEEEIESGSFPGGSALVATRDRVLEEATAGRASVLPSDSPLEDTTLFDLASLTKPLCAGALAWEAVRNGLDLSAAPGRFFPAWKKTRFDGISLEMLLTHTSGLAAWFPVYTGGEGADAYRRTLAALEPETAPGAAVVYSDLGMIVFGEVLEAFFSGRIDRIYEELVRAAAGSGARYLPEDPSACAATEADDATERAMTAELGLSYPWFRTGVVRGDVHDGNAFRRGGVSAHAGLFGTARDAWRLAVPWLDPGRADFTRDRTSGLSEARGLSWQGARGAGSLPKDAISPRSFGHTGFTGTSVWIDPDAGSVFVLLTNRVHPRITEPDFNSVRRRFHERAAKVGR